MRDQIDRGEDLLSLAEKHTLRRRGKENKGEFHIHPFEKQQFGELIEAACGAGIGQLIGPVGVTVKPSEVLGADPSMPEGRYYSSLSNSIYTTHRS